MTLAVAEGDWNRTSSSQTSHMSMSYKCGGRPEAAAATVKASRTTMKNRILPNVISCVRTDSARPINSLCFYGFRTALFGSERWRFATGKTGALAG
jgi:hypothetical protein